MESDSKTQAHLSIRQRVKGLPYFGGPREGGSTNHGFQLLKNSGLAVDSIPEASDEPSILRLLEILNAADSPFLSLGCEKVLTENDGRWFKRGYIEFTIDSIEIAGDARSSFFVFYQFDKYLNQVHFNEPITFHFELEGNALDRVNAAIYSVICWITTNTWTDSPEETNLLWAKGVDVLATFFQTMRGEEVAGTRISAMVKSVPFEC